ncbi:MAG TPA: hypothetical protein VEL28_09470 [Candidatus Binatia bacterium]|nr:hypothetical protein [Candidatus Binatia bacterium]
MKKFIMPIAAVAVVAFAGSASAQCDFNVVAKAKGLKSSMIRAYAACPSTEHPSVNDPTSGGTPACSPVTAKKDEGGTGVGSDYLFDPSGKGGCSVSTSGKIVPDCGALTDDSDIPLNLPPGPCHVVYVKGKCKGIMQSDGKTPINAGDDPGWSLATLSRASLNDGNGKATCSGGTEDGEDCSDDATACTTGGGACEEDGSGDVTVIDFPVTFQFDDPSNGQLSLDDNSARVLADIVSPQAAALPTCTQIQVVDITLKDPAGRAFAVLGGGSAAKGDLPSN